MALRAIGIVLLASAVSADEIELLTKHLSSPVLASRQTTAEAQAHLASRVKPMPELAGRAQWEKQARVLRELILRHVIFRGKAAAWRNIPTRPEWLETIRGNGYRIRKFRYEVVPGMWMPGLLYEPAVLHGRVPVVLNLNGHEEEGMASSYVQERCAHLARNGVLAFNPEWFGRGQMSGPGFDHYRLNQIDLTGSSGLALFYLAQTRLLDIALEHPHADASRVAVTGFSGGGWQALLLSSMDLRVSAAVPVAGYSSFLTRTQFPEMDLGDSEQTPVDLGLYADYTHLTALLAPRPTLLVYNARDNCCFRADYALPPLLEAARPFFDVYGAGRLRSHVGFEEGHNYGPDNRRALYGFLADVFFAGKGGFSTEETPSATDVRNAAELRVPVPGRNEDFHTLAVRLAENLPREGGVPVAPSALRSWQSRYRRKLRDLVRWPDYTVRAQEVTSQEEGELRITASRLSLDGVWNVPSVEFAPVDPAGTTLVFGDAGRSALASQIQSLLQRRQRVVAIDPYSFGESRIESRDFLYALLVSALGERPLGIEAGQAASVARWLKQKYGPVSVAAYGPRTSLVALVAAALEFDAILGVELSGAMRTLREPIERDWSAVETPELFCFGLLEFFDVKQLTALVSPREIALDPQH